MAQVEADGLGTRAPNISAHLGLLQPDVTRQYLSLPKFPNDAQTNGTFDVGKFVAAFNNDTDVDGIEIGSPPPVSMQRIRDHLRACLSKIKSELVNNINRDYEQFVKLTAGLDDVQKALDLQYEPFVSLHASAKHLHRQLANARIKFEGKMNEKVLMARRKQSLIQFIRMHQGLNKLETICSDAAKSNGEEKYSEKSPSPPSMSLPLLERCARLTADVRECLEGQMNESSHTKATCQEVERRLATAIAKVQSLIDAAFEEMVVPNQDPRGVALPSSIRHLAQVDEDSIAHCLRCYAVMGCEDIAETIMASKIVKPFATTVLVKSRMDGGGLRGSYAGLGALLDKILAFVDMHCSHVLRAAHNALGADSGFDFLGNGIWQPVAAVLLRHHDIFSSAIPQTFHLNFLTLARFLDQLETRYLVSLSHPSYDPRHPQPDIVTAVRPRIVRFRNHKWSLKFKQAWKMDIYHNLCFQRICRPLETMLCDSALRDAQVTGSKSKAKEFSLKPPGAVWAAVQQCWSSSVLLPPIRTQMFSLTLQILNRFSQWLTQGSTPHATAKGGGGSVSKPKIRNPASLLFLAADATEMQRRVREELAPIIQRQISRPSLDPPGGDSEGSVAPPLCIILPNQIEEAKEAVSEALSQWSTDLSTTIAGLRNQLISLVAAKCKASLESIRNIPAAYRLSSKPMPTRFSPFVPNTMRNLSNFLRGWGQLIGAESIPHFVSSVVEDVLHRYREIVADVIDIVTKRLQSSSMGDKGMMAKKIFAQLHLDSEEFAQQMARLRPHPVDPQGCEPYRALIATIDDAERQIVSVE